MGMSPNFKMKKSAEQNKGSSLPLMGLINHLDTLADLSHTPGLSIHIKIGISIYFNDLI